MFLFPAPREVDGEIYMHYYLIENGRYLFPAPREVDRELY